MWGVQMQFSSRSKAEPCKIGSDSNTSTAAMPGRPRLRAPIRALVSTSSAREVLTSKDVGFMSPKSSLVTMPVVASLSLRCKDSTSEL